MFVLIAPEKVWKWLLLCPSINAAHIVERRLTSPSFGVYLNYDTVISVQNMHDF